MERQIDLTTAILKEHERLMEANRIMAARLAKSYGWLLASQEKDLKLEEKRS